jgi:hypothetical protein
MTKIIDPNVSFDDVDDKLLIRKDQTITQEFLEGIKEDRLASNSRAGEYHKVASVPTVVVEKWLREGFDIWRETPQAILKKLRSENLDAFIATTKRI